MTSTEPPSTTDTSAFPSLNASLFSSLPPSIQSLILATESWLSSTRNTSQLQLSSYQPSSHDVVIAIPSFSSSFTLTLSAPHSLSTESELLEELETEAFQFCFGQQQRAVEEVLDFVDGWLKKDGAGWDRARDATHGRKGRKRKVEHKETEAGVEEEGEVETEESMLDDADMSDTAAGDEDDDDDDDAEWQQEAADDWGEAVEYDLVAATTSEQANQHGDSALLPAASHPQFGSFIMRADISRLQSAMIDDVSSLLRITRSSAATLLRHCRWDQADTVRRFRADASKLAAEAGVAAQLHADVSPPLPARSSRTCCICFDDASSERLFALPCSHFFCLACWREYLRSQVEGGDVSGKNALATRCPDSKCKEVMGMDACEMILGEDDEAGEALLARYRQMLQHSFVDDSDSLAWCPRADCDRVVVLSRRQRSVTCLCGHRFCLQCKSEAHAPATCDEALQWSARDKGSENLDTKWILEQSKACPKCGTRTRKEGGCMHIVCTICHMPWCWQCGQSDHHVYDCNRPPWGEHKDSTSDLNRYLWYYERFFNHSQSLKTTEQQLQATAAKMDELVSEGLHFRRTEFLQQAVRVIIQCRRVLRWTYVHAFYVANDTERELFEYRQGELESMTEQLNKLTEAGVMELQAKRKAVLDWTTALRSYMDGIENDQTTQLVKATKQHAAAGDEKKEGGKDGQQQQQGGRTRISSSSSSQPRSSAWRQAAPKTKEEDEWRTDDNGLIIRAKKVRQPQPDSAAAYKEEEAAAGDDALAAAEDERKDDEAAVGQPEAHLTRPKKASGRMRQHKPDDGDEWEADMDSLQLQQFADQQAAAVAGSSDAALQLDKAKEVIVLDCSDDDDQAAAAYLATTAASIGTKQVQRTDVATAAAAEAATAVET